MNRTSWTREKVIESIKRRADAGLRLSYSATLADEEALIGAARRLFGSWDAAVTAAGYDIRRYKYALQEDNEEAWDRDRVLHEMREYTLSGGNLSAGYVRKYYSKLYSAAVAYLGSWRAALAELGIDYNEVILRAKWSPELVIKTIQQAHKDRADLSDRTVDALRGDLYGAAQSHFGSWAAAVEAAGLRPEEVRRTREWSREKIADFAARCYEAGITVRQLVNAGIIHSNVISKYFRGARDLYDAIGVTATAETDTLTSRLKEIMRLKNVSVSDLAKKIGRTDMHVRHLINRNQPPKLADALRIAKALNCNVNDIWDVK